MIESLFSFIYTFCNVGEGLLTFINDITFNFQRKVKLKSTMNMYKYVCV